MRIGMMADVYKPYISGVTNYIALNKKQLESQGHEVFVFTFSSGEYKDEEDNVIRSPGLPILDTGLYFSLRYTNAARWLLQTMDVVHVHHPFLSGTLALFYCRSRGIPIIFTNHTRYDLYTQAYLPMMPDVVGKSALQAYLPTFCRACDLVISPSAGMRDVLQTLGVDCPIEVVPNGVDLKPFRDPTTPVRRAELGFNEDDVVLIYVGRLGPEKNVPFLVQSFVGAVQAFDRLRLVMIGTGPERQNLEERIERAGIGDHVRLMGSVPYHQVPGYLAMADAFVTASVTEVHPLAVIEAMASGLPVLGICSPGISDSIENGYSGYLVPKEDLAMFTGKMALLAFDGEQRRIMGANARRAAEMYSIERTVNLMLECYRRVDEEAAPRRRSWRVRLRRGLDRILR